ncbi:MAG: hypothetical protein U0136_13310 [Bdellovibrionota bacterium]
MAKALKTLELSLGPPPNERLRRDAFNAANSAYRDIRSKYADTSVEADIACTLVCACDDTPNVNLLGNFESALSRTESLSRSRIREIEHELLEQLKNDGW